MWLNMEDGQNGTTTVIHLGPQLIQRLKYWHGPAHDLYVKCNIHLLE